MDSSVKVFLWFIGLVVVVNLLFVDAWMVSQSKENLASRLDGVEEKLGELLIGQSRVTDDLVTGSAGEVGEDSKEEEEEEVEAAELAGEVAKETVEVRSSSTVVKEVFIPLGSASTYSTEWVDTGAQVYIDTTIYPNLSEAYFQASLRSNSGVVFARLMQKNEGTYVFNTEISHDTPTSAFVSSARANLSSGNKLYGVQIRSETGQEGFVENSRVRLVLR